MNECEQIHPLLRGFLSEELTARDRRLVARHLNLCAMARKEMDRLRSGPLRGPLHPVEPPSEPWDLKILRWLFKTPGHKPPASPRPNRRAKQPMEPLPEPAQSPSALKPILGVIAIFVGLAFVTHFIQNADKNTALLSAKRWLSKKGFPGMKPSLEMVQDLTNLPSWNGPSARAVGPFSGMILDETHFDLYWRILNPGAPKPEINFNENALALVLLGTKPEGGRQPKFLRAENYSDKTVFWFDEVPFSTAQALRPWVLQLVPKPSAGPVLIQKVP